MIAVYDERVEEGSCADLFHAFAPYDNHLLCFFRRHRILSHGSGRSDYHSSIWMADWDGSSLSNARLILDGCDDPRVVRHRDRLLVFTTYAPAGSIVSTLMYSHPSGAFVELSMPNGVSCGKNWQPVSCGDRLCVLHSFAPLRWLEVDVATGRVTLTSEASIGLDLPAPHDGYTMYRGGSNALASNGCIHGSGHITHRVDRHLPFRWEYARAPACLKIHMLSLSDLAHRFGIIDPASLWESDGARWMSVSCSERDWFSGQRFASYILEAA